MIEYDVGTGPVLVLIHGHGEGYKSLLSLENTPSINRWRRVFIDIRWASRVDASAVPSAQEVARLVLAVLEERLGAQPVAFLGNGFGGLIARYLAHQWNGNGRALGLATLFTPIVDRCDHEPVSPRQSLSGISTDPVHALLMSRSRSGNDSGIKGPRFSIRGDGAEKSSASGAPEATWGKAFLVPTLHLSNGPDNLLDHEDYLTWRDHYPHATLAELDAAGTNTDSELPALVYVLIADWLQRMVIDMGRQKAEVDVQLLPVTTGVIMDSIVQPAASSDCRRAGFSSTAKLQGPRLPVKPATKPDQQADILKRRGMVLDESHANQWLSCVSYYRLSGYWYPYRQEGDSKRADRFEPGTTFADVARLYEFDRKLRTLIHDAMERIEIALRNRIGEVIVTKGPLSYRDATRFRNESTYLR